MEVLAGDRGCLLEGWPAVSFGTWAVLGVASSLGEGSARADGVDGWDGVQDVLVLACGVAGICGMRMGWVMLLSCGREQCSPSGSMYGPAWDALCGTWACGAADGRWCVVCSRRNQYLFFDWQQEHQALGVGGLGDFGGFLLAGGGMGTQEPPSAGLLSWALDDGLH